MEYDIALARLSRQRIAGQHWERPEEVVRWMGAMQAQDYQQALWAIGLRVQSGTLAIVEQAINERKILRTWPMRGTIHFVPAEDAKWMVQLSAPRLLAADGRRLRQLELDVPTIMRCSELFQAALQGGRRLTRPAMLQLLESAGISTVSQRGYHILWYLSQSGLLCFGPMEGKQQTFVLLDEWVPNSRRLLREEALAELAGRYFASHGPATRYDFAWWAGLTLTDVKTGLAGAKPAVIPEQINGTEYWLAGNTPTNQNGGASGVYLLPGFDEYLLGYKDRGAVLAAEHAAKIVPGGNGMFLPTIVADGQVVGTWKRAIKKQAVAIQLSFFTGANKYQAAAIEAAQAYGAYLQLPVTIEAVR